MLTNEIYEKIVSITFALWVMFSAVGWLGIKKSKKSYIVLWIGIIPLIISTIFVFFTSSYYDSILLTIIILFCYLVYIFFLIINTYKFFKVKEDINEKEQFKINLPPIQNFNDKV